jgi:hypothetical protein
MLFQNKIIDILTKNKQVKMNSIEEKYQEAADAKEEDEVEEDEVEEDEVEEDEVEPVTYKCFCCFKTCQMSKMYYKNNGFYCSLECRDKK